jgi:hypothetical protein
MLCDNTYLKIEQGVQCRWLTPIILATQEAEIRRIEVHSQPGLIVSQKTPSYKRAGGIAQGEGPKFKPQYHKKKKRAMTQ